MTRVVALDFDAYRFWAKVDVRGQDECWPWTAAKIKTKYDERGIFHVRNIRRGWVYAHRVAFFIQHGYLTDGLEVCHSCDFPLCCSWRHLFEGTHQENMADSLRKGRRPAGGNNLTHTVLTVEKVHVIRDLLAQGVFMKEVARRMNISQSTVESIKYRQRWWHV